MGLTRKVVANSLYANLNGYTVSEYYERDRAIDVISSRLDKSDRKSLDEIQNISICTCCKFVTGSRDFLSKREQHDLASDLRLPLLLMLM